MSIAEDIRRRLGFTSRDESVQAERYMNLLSQRADPEARLAAGVADALVPSDPKRRADSDGMARLMVHDLQGDARPLPTDPSIRRMHIAQAVLGAAERHVSEGSDQGLVPELGRAARLETIRRMSITDVRARGLDGAMITASEKRTRTVASYLSDGAPIARHMDQLLLDIPKRGETLNTIARLHESREFHPSPAPDSGPPLRSWVKNGLEAERAAARAGLIEPASVVRIAEQAMKGADIDTLSTYPRARPDFAAAATLSPDRRQREFARSITAMRASEKAQSSPDASPAATLQSPARTTALQAQAAAARQHQR